MHFTRKRRSWWLSSESWGQRTGRGLKPSSQTACGSRQRSDPDCWSKHHKTAPRRWRPETCKHHIYSNDKIQSEVKPNSTHQFQVWIKVSHTFFLKTELKCLYPKNKFEILLLIFFIHWTSLCLKAASALPEDFILLKLYLFFCQKQWNLNILSHKISDISAFKSPSCATSVYL